MAGSSAYKRGLPSRPVTLSLTMPMTPGAMIMQEKYTLVLNLMVLVRKKMTLGTIGLPKHTIKHRSYKAAYLMAA